MKREIKVGTISWIDAHPNPIWTSGQAGVLEPAWLPKTYLGLAATKNAAPPKTLADFVDYQSKKDFRALTYCRFAVDIDDDTGAVSSFRVIDAIHDPGWTPYFKMRHWPASAMSFDGDIWFGFTDYQGEASPISLVNTQARHKYSSISTIPGTETVLVNAIIKFRAGSHTDDVGVKTVKAPYHVPWVWCEMALTYAQGKLKLYGRGSIFPSHAWYLDDKQVGALSQAGDTSFPVYSRVLGGTPSFWAPGLRVPSIPTTGIIVTGLKIYPVLSAGAPASGPQTSLAAESSVSGPVEGHPNTVSGGAVVTYP